MLRVLVCFSGLCLEILRTEAGDWKVGFVDIVRRAS